jgi:hypothetical protein
VDADEADLTDAADTARAGTHFRRVHDKPADAQMIIGGAVERSLRRTPNHLQSIRAIREIRQIRVRAVPVIDQT